MNITQALKTDLNMQPTSSGDIGRIAGIPNVKRRLFRRLMTVPGTLAHRPTYGVGIPSYQNSPSTFAIQQTVAALIKEQFELDPDVQSVDSIAFNTTDDQPWYTIVAVSVTIVGYTDAQPMVFSTLGDLNAA